MKNHKKIKQIQNFYEKHLEDMLHKHSKVFQVRFDLRYPEDGSIKHDPKHRSDFNEYMKRDLERNYPLPKEGRKRSDGKTKEDQHKVDPRLVTVQEHHADRSPHPHFHCLVLLNGNAKNSAYDIHKRAERQWNNVLGVKDHNALVDYCNKQGPPSIMIDRNSNDYEDDKKAAKDQASYMHKKNGKDSIPTRYWKVIGTRLPKKS